MDLEESRNRWPADDASRGWDAIDAALAPLYGGQEPSHYAPPLPAALGGADPIDGISLYRSTAGGVPHVHLVTYGLSHLYDDEAQLGKEFSRFGFELTFRLRQDPADPQLPTWAVNMAQNLARDVFKSGRWFEPGHHVPANGPIKLGDPTVLVGMVFDVDPEHGTIDTPHGQVQFLQMFGATQAELDRMKAGPQGVQDVLAEHRARNPLLITDLARP